MISRLKENQSRSQFTLSNVNRRNQQILWYTLNALDVYTTHRGLKHPNVRELNPLLPSKPSLGELLLFKSLVLPLVHNMTTDDYVFGNKVMIFAVANNTYVLHKVGIIDLND